MSQILDLSPDGFEELSSHALSLAPSTQRVVLSTQRVALHNEALDRYMAKYYPDTWRDDDVSEDVALFVLAATGRVFLRIRVGEVDNEATPVQADGVVYMTANEETAEYMYEEALFAINSATKH